MHDKVLPDWQNMNIINRGRVQSHSTFLPFSNSQNAVSQQRGMSDLFKLLSGEWKFSYTEVEAHSPEGFEKPETDVSDWNNITVPSCWQFFGYGVKNYLNTRYAFPVNPPFVPYENAAGCYRTEFNIPEKWEKKNVNIVFEGVCSSFHLWVNGQLAGYSQGSHLPSEFDISPYINTGKNVLAVKVYQWSYSTYLEAQDMWRFNGILSPIACMAAIHCAAAVQNILAVEYHSSDIPWWNDLAKGIDNPLIVDGFANVPNKPGLGIDELNEELIAQHIHEKYPGQWESTQMWDNEWANDREWS